MCEQGFDPSQDIHFFRAITKQPQLSDELFYIDYNMCPHCGFVFRDAFPDEESLESYYKTFYRPGGEDPNEKEINIEKSRARVWVDWLRRTQTFSPFLYREEGIPANHIDIGSSTGAFGGLLKLHGTKSAVGVEPGMWVDYSKRYLDHVFTNIDDIPANLYHQFDLVSICHVLEHVPDPVTTILKLRRLMTPNGRLLIAVPDMHRRTNSTFAFPHLSVFTIRTLKTLLHLAGLEITDRLYNAPELSVIAKLAEPKYTIKPPLPLFEWKIKKFWRLYDRSEIFRHWVISSYGPDTQTYPPKFLKKLSVVFRKWYILFRGFYSTALFLLRRLLFRAKLGRNRKNGGKD
jgi:SAM-dependent methyltransferase